MAVTTIPLSAKSSRSNCGKYQASVDECDAEWASGFDWSADVRRFPGGLVVVYAYRWDRDGRTRSSPKHKRYMHREVARRAGIIASRIDHRDSDGLNNTRDNLRAASGGQNAANTRKRGGNASGYKGVCWHALTGKWRARLDRMHLGLFASAEDAARAYDKAAVARYGEFARGNFTQAVA